MPPLVQVALSKSSNFLATEENASSYAGQRFSKEKNTKITFIELEESSKEEARPYHNMGRLDVVLGDGATKKNYIIRELGKFHAQCNIVSYVHRNDVSTKKNGVAGGVVVL